MPSIIFAMTIIFNKSSPEIWGLSFALLKAMPRKEAIQRMDVILKRLEPTRPFHETRQSLGPAGSFQPLKVVERDVVEMQGF